MTAGGRISTFKTKILPSTIKPDPERGCVYYVTRNDKAGWGTMGGRYTVFAMCEGGRMVTGDNGHDDLKKARAKVKRMAASASSRDRRLLRRRP